MPNEIELIDLGNDEETGTVEAATRPETQNEKLLFLERRLNQMALSIDSINSLIKQMRSESRERIKREFAINQTVSKSMADKKLPVGLTLVGYTGGTPYYLEVAKDGFYVGINNFIVTVTFKQGLHTFYKGAFVGVVNFNSSLLYFLQRFNF